MSTILKGSDRKALLRSAANARRSAVRPGGTGGGDERTPYLFISYSRKDIKPVQALVRRLRAEGIAVEWDQDFIGGEDFRRLITKAIDGSRCVIVVWSPASVQSDYVIGEATRARQKSMLVPTYIEGLDFDDIPIDLSRLQAVPLEDWKRVRTSLMSHGFRLEG